MEKVKKIVHPHGEDQRSSVHIEIKDVHVEKIKDLVCTLRSKMYMWRKSKI